jgi:hypothetical protein
VLYDESVRKGAGTISECQHAFNRDIPIFLINTYGDINEVPGWLQALTTRIFNSFDKLYSYLSDLPPGILKKDIYGNMNAGDCYLCSLCGDAFIKNKQHFVSKISPLYCTNCVDVVTKTFEGHKDRYQFFVEYLESEADDERE